MSVNTYNQKGEKNGAVELPKSAFGLSWNPTLVWQVFESERSNRRSSTAHTKDRSEVRGGGKKPWRQKGTGRARHGSIRSPIWIGGGVAHGPRNEKSYEKKINKKMKKKAVLTALSKKASDNEILILDKVSFESAKTKDVAGALKALSALKGFEGLAKGMSALILLPKSDSHTIRAIRNIKNASVMEARNLNIVDLLSSRYLILDKESVEVLAKKAA